MILILIALVVAAVVSGLLFWYNDNENANFPGFIGFLLAIATGISAIAYIFCGWEWLASEHKMHIINREYGTSYTMEEIFYASDVIDTIRELDRKRVEVNGNIMRGSDR